MDEIRKNIIDSISLYRHYDIEIERRVNLLIDQGELTQKAGTQLLKKLLSINNEVQDSRRDIEEVMFEYLHEQNIPTKTDLQILIQKIDSISQMVDELHFNGK